MGSKWISGRLAGRVCNGFSLAQDWGKWQALVNMMITSGFCHHKVSSQTRKMALAMNRYCLMYCLMSHFDDYTLLNVLFFLSYFLLYFLV
jgi:hypothetical protein